MLILRSWKGKPEKRIPSPVSTLGDFDLEILERKTKKRIPLPASWNYLYPFIDKSFVWWSSIRWFFGRPFGGPLIVDLVGQVFQILLCQVFNPHCNLVHCCLVVLKESRFFYYHLFNYQKIGINLAKNIYSVFVFDKKKIKI